MIAPPLHILPDDNVLPALRELLAQRPYYQNCSVERLANALKGLGYLNHRPHEAVVEAALQALRVEDEVLP